MRARMYPEEGKVFPPIEREARINLILASYETILSFVVN